MITYLQIDCQYTRFPGRHYGKEMSQKCNDKVKYHTGNVVIHLNIGWGYKRYPQPSQTLSTVTFSIILTSRYRHQVNVYPYRFSLHRYWSIVPAVFRQFCVRLIQRRSLLLRRLLPAIIQTPVKLCRWQNPSPVGR